MKTKFAKGLLIYCLILAGSMLALMILLGAYLVSFQKSLSDDAIKRFVGDLKSNTESTVEQYFNPTSPYETKESLASSLKDIIEKDEITYSKNLKESSAEAPVYYAKVGEDLIIKTVFENSGSVGFGMTGWEISSVDIVENAIQQDALEICIPHGASLYINGIEAKEESLLGQFPPKDLESLYNQGFVSDSCFETKYEIAGLLAKPQIKVIDQAGNEVETEEKDGIICPKYEAPREFCDAVRQRVLSVIEPYALFQANDLAFSGLSPYLLDGTEMKWRIGSSDVKWFASHSSLNITEAEMKDVKLYDENTFSCNVTFTQVITKSGIEETNYSDYTWVFVASGGEWYMADMFTNSTDENL